MVWMFCAVPVTLTPVVSGPWKVVANCPTLLQDVVTSSWLSWLGMGNYIQSPLVFCYIQTHFPTFFGGLWEVPQDFLIHFCPLAWLIDPLRTPDYSNCQLNRRHPIWEVCQLTKTKDAAVHVQTYRYTWISLKDLPRYRSLFGLTRCLEKIG